MGALFEPDVAPEDALLTTGAALNGIESPPKVSAWVPNSGPLLSIVILLWQPVLTKRFELLLICLAVGLSGIAVLVQGTMLQVLGF